MLLVFTPCSLGPGTAFLFDSEQRNPATKCDLQISSTLWEGWQLYLRRNPSKFDHSTWVSLSKRVRRCWTHLRVWWSNTWRWPNAWGATVHENTVARNLLYLPDEPRKVPTAEVEHTEPAERFHHHRDVVDFFHGLFQNSGDLLQSRSWKPKVLSESMQYVCTFSSGEIILPPPSWHLWKFGEKRHHPMNKVLLVFSLFLRCTFLQKYKISYNCSTMFFTKLSYIDWHSQN